LISQKLTEKFEFIYIYLTGTCQAIKPGDFQYFIYSLAKNDYVKNIFLFSTWCFLVISCNNKQKSADISKSTAISPDSTSNKLPQAELADDRYSDIVKTAMSQFASGDIDGWLSHYADNAVIRQSPVDSIFGKEAIAKLWKNRRKTVTGSIEIENDIWIPQKINFSRKGDDLKEGIWLFNWHHVNLESKNGNRQKFWVHTDFHFDNNDKIDIMLEYFDPGPVLAAVNK
jgi:hypothetical protein